MAAKTPPLRPGTYTRSDLYEAHCPWGGDCEIVVTDRRTVVVRRDGRAWTEKVDGDTYADQSYAIELALERLDANLDIYGGWTRRPLGPWAKADS